MAKVRNAFCILVLLGYSFATASVPLRFNYQAKLTDGSGNGLKGSHKLFFSIWDGGDADTPDSGTIIFEESTILNLVDGVANHPVGGGGSQDAGPLSAQKLRTAGTLYLQVAVGNVSNVLLPRSRLESVPFAIASADGETKTPISTPASFPIVISQPGSYFLTENIIGVASQHGIQVTTQDVTLDLAGFALIGVPQSRSGIYVSATTPNNISIRNGTVRNWGSSGIESSGIGRYWRLDNVSARSNGGNGINAGQVATLSHCIADGNSTDGLSATTSIFHDCIAQNNNGHGIAGNVVEIRDCIAFNNGGHGIYANFSSVLTHCVAESNVGNGFNIVTANSVIGCTAYANKGDGLKVEGYGNLVRDNTFTTNGSGVANAAGIHILNAGGNRIEGNLCTYNDRGIDVDGPDNFFSRNTCRLSDENNWDVAAGNKILVVNGVSAGAFMGNSGGTAPGSTDPNANFSF